MSTNKENQNNPIQNNKPNINLTLLVIYYTNSPIPPIMRTNNRLIYEVNLLTPYSLS